VAWMAGVCALISMLLVMRIPEPRQARAR
jgi:hypothetical protein